MKWYEKIVKWLKTSTDCNWRCDECHYIIKFGEMICHNCKAKTEFYYRCR